VNEYANQIERTLASQSGLLTFLLTFACFRLVSPLSIRALELEAGVGIGLQDRVMRGWEWEGDLREGSLLDTGFFKLDFLENEIRLGRSWNRGEWRLSI